MASKFVFRPLYHINANFYLVVTTAVYASIVGCLCHDSFLNGSESVGGVCVSTGPSDPTCGYPSDNLHRSLRRPDHSLYNCGHHARTFALRTGSRIRTRLHDCTNWREATHSVPPVSLATEQVSRPLAWSLAAAAPT